MRARAHSEHTIEETVVVYTHAHTYITHTGGRDYETVYIVVNFAYLKEGDTHSLQSSKYAEF